MIDAPLKCVDVEWVDAGSAGKECDWLRPDDVPAIPIVTNRTVGFLVREDAERVIIAQSVTVDEDPLVFDLLVIPRCMIVAVRVVP